MSKIAIVAALEREVHALVKGWVTERIEHAGKAFKFFVSDHAVLVCGGMGVDAARRATVAILSRMQPVLIVSTGFARALNDDQHVADIVIPAEVFDIAQKQSFKTLFGSGRMWTSFQVVENSPPPESQQLFDCRAIDMEAAGVAQVAASRNVPFLAVKSISDDVHFKMPPVGQFIDADGGFRTAAFALHVALRPRTWASVAALAANSSLAAEKLCSALRSLIENKTVQGFDLQVELARIGVEVAS